MRYIDEQSLEIQGVVWPADFHDCISRTQEVAEVPLRVPADILARLKEETSGLLIDESTLLEIASALVAGNIILQGPPGTGKTTLASAISRAFNADYSTVTGREDMSTYDLVGHQDLYFDEDSKQEKLIPTDGAFTRAVIECAGAISRNYDDPNENPISAHWLIVDELNRASIDRAFGELFTAIGSTDTIGIPLRYYGSKNVELFTPKSFRIIGTINSIDKQFVNSMSLAIRRRFTFITIDIPPQKPEAETWATGNSPAAKEYRIAIEAACQRINQKRDGTDFTLAAVLGHHGPKLSELFTALELVRYASADSDFPYLPIGIAPLIDTVELFLSRMTMVGNNVADAPGALDWAASVKLGPLFDVDHLDSEQVRSFAKKLTSLSPSRRFATELRRLAAAGLSYSS